MEAPVGVDAAAGHVARADRQIVAFAQGYQVWDISWVVREVGVHGDDPVGPIGQGLS